MTEQEATIGIVKQLYDAFERRDISFLLDMFTDDTICMDLHPQVRSLGAVFTKVLGELQNSSRLLASHLNPNSLS
jgi:ketosteroid isomerase-like protein